MIVCVTYDDYFYPIHAAPKGVTEKDWARSNGEINDHVKRIEDVSGNILWERLNQ